eukprot:Skav209457  [mRNA]  locus=scaffold4290:22951:24548:- [translate_table: standard]
MARKPTDLPLGESWGLSDNRKSARRSKQHLCQAHFLPCCGSSPESRSLLLDRKFHLICSVLVGGLEFIENVPQGNAKLHRLRFHIFFLPCERRFSCRVPNAIFQAGGPRCIQLTPLLVLRHLFQSALEAHKPKSSED